MRTTATNRKLRTLLTGIKAGTLVPRPEFQRRLVWANRHKLAFIQTVLGGFPFPEIYVAAGQVNPDTGEGTEMLVDGQQRMSTLFEYFTGSEELKLRNEVPTYAELTSDRKIEFLEYDVVVRDLGQLGIPDIKEVFTRINSTNYALNAMEIHNARFDGAFKQFGEDVVKHDFFETNRVFSAADARRMNDLRFTLTLTATTMSTYFNRDDELEDFLLRFNDEFPQREKVLTELDSVFRFITDCDFSTESRAWRKPDLFTLLVETHRLLVREGLQLDPSAVREQLEDFWRSVGRVRDLDQAETSNEAVADVFRYYKAAIQATNDRNSRITRGEIVASHLRRSSQRKAQGSLLPAAR